MKQVTTIFSKMLSGKGWLLTGDNTSSFITFLSVVAVSKARKLQGTATQYIAIYIAICGRDYTCQENQQTSANIIYSLASVPDAREIEVLSRYKVFLHKNAINWIKGIVVFRWGDSLQDDYSIHYSHRQGPPRETKHAQIPEHHLQVRSCDIGMRSIA